MGELLRLKKDPSVYILWEEDIIGSQLGSILIVISALSDISGKS